MIRIQVGWHDMYRKIRSFLESWKASKNRKPLILQGARQVGKTFSILEFGKTHYDNVAYFNFETNPRLSKTFEESISPDYLLPILSHIAKRAIIKDKTLIVFEEIQLCERALTSLKYFCELAPEYHITAAATSSFRRCLNPRRFFRIIFPAIGMSFPMFQPIRKIIS